MFRSGKQKSFADRVFLDGIDGLIRQSVHDLGPGLPAVGRSEYMRVQVIQTDTVDRSIGGVHIAMAGIHQGYFTPGGDTGRGYIVPVLSPVLCYLYQPVVCTAPNGIGINIRRGHGIDHAPSGHLFYLFAFVNAYISRYLRSDIILRPCQVGTDDLPATATGGCFKQHIAGIEQVFFVYRTEQYRCRPYEPVFAAANHFRGYMLRLTVAFIIF